MKKILGISLVAVLAVTPLMASAADLTEQQMAKATVVEAGDNEIGDANRMAAVSYVKGAYTELGTAINTKQDQLTAGQAEVDAAIVTDGNLAGTVQAASDTKLVSEKAIVQAIENAKTEATYDDTALSGRVTTAEGKITTLEGKVGDSTSGLVKDVADLGTTVGDSTSGLVKDVADLGTTVGDSNSGLVKDVADLKTEKADFAKKTGVTATITASTVSGTVPVLATWGNSTTTNAPITASITGASYREPQS